MQTATRQQAHAIRNTLNAGLDKRDAIRFYAERYIAQIDRTRLPVGYRAFITCDHSNQIDAWRMHGRDLARLLGIGTNPRDDQFPGTARAVLATLDAPVNQLVAAATATGHPGAVALIHILAA